MLCPVCGQKDCHGDVPVLLTADQLADIGIKPDQLTAGGTIAMADQTEPKGRYPRQEVNKGQKHGYIGEVEVYDPPQAEGGFSNVEAAKPTTTRQSAKDATPEEAPIVGAAGLVGGTVDNVSAPKK